jgi:hypothetical protein
MVLSSGSESTDVRFALETAEKAEKAPKRRRRQERQWGSGDGEEMTGRVDE